MRPARSTLGIALGLAIAGLLVPAAGRAQDPAAAKLLEAAFARLDPNRDGRIERAEFPGSDVQFAMLGPGADGVVTAAEFATSPFGRQLLAAQLREASAPRPRVDPEAGIAPRIEAALRLDQNRDGRVTESEWTGDAVTFAALDLDGDGAVDRSDLAEARRRAPAAAAASAGGLPEFKRELEPAPRLLERHDRDRNGALSPAELRGSRAEPAFVFADRDGNGELDLGELERLVGEVRRRVLGRNRGDARAPALQVPFGSWDKNGDGRLEVGEWQGPPYLFPRMDRDRDAALTEAEIERYLRAVAGETFLERFDLNGDGRVTGEEFGGPPAAFRRFDRNGDGVVSAADR
jgi:Ca2+-binding EF-hand superfamily protein